MQYALLVRCDENALVSPEERAARGKVFASFAEEQRARGVLLADHRLLPTMAARTVQVWGGDVVTADGPFSKTREQIGELLIVACSGLDDAVKLATLVPAAWYGTIEVRQVREK
jgi:hypothetical protein